MWSREILAEVVEHLIANIDAFDEEAGERLVAALNATFQSSQVELTDEATAAVTPFELTDEDDRHVIVAAVAAEATFLCTDDLSGFPQDVMATLGIEVVTCDTLLRTLMEEAGDAMLGVHRAVVSGLPGATDESTIAALRRAKAFRTADLMEALLDRLGK